MNDVEQDAVVLILEAAAVILTGIRLLLDRLDKRKDTRDEHLDIQGALLDLHALLRSWVRQAGATNFAVGTWIAAGMPDDIEETLRREALKSQGVFLRETFALLGVKIPGERRRRKRISYEHGGSLHQVLSAYAPELRSALDEATMLRATQLEGMISEIRSRAAGQGGSIDEYLDDLRLAERKLKDAEEAVRGFLVVAFPIGTSLDPSQDD